MKMINYLLVALFATGMMSSCKKEDGVNPEFVKQADEFKAFVQSKQFQIKKYYADKPIDYVEDDDTVRLETDLSKYISGWLRDDFNVLDNSSGKVTITQNENKMPGNDAETIVKDISIGADKDGAYFNFLSHEYQPLKYRLIGFSASSFEVYVDWHSGGRVITEFQVIQ